MNQKLPNFVWGDKALQNRKKPNHLKLPQVMIQKKSKKMPFDLHWCIINFNVFLMEASPPHSKVAVIIAALLLLSSGSLYGLQDEQPETKRILVLFSYHEGLPYEKLINESLQDTLASQSAFLIQVNVEHTNLNKYADDAYRRKLFDLYLYKYSHPKMDLVLGIGDEAVNMLLDYGEKLFPEIPMVFLTSYSNTLRRDLLKPNTVSLQWEGTISANVELIREILPQTRDIFIVAGTSPSDRAPLKRWQAALGQVMKGFAVHYLTDLSANDLISQAAKLPDKSAIFFLVFFRDAEGKSFVPQEFLSILSKQARVPIFGPVDTYLGYGIVGGNLLSGEGQGRRCAEIALRILRGESPKDMIPERILNQLMFDWRQLKRWGISEDKLPPGSIVRFKTYSFWDLYRGYIVAAFFLILVQSGLISFLLRQRTRRRRAEEKYRTVADYTYEWEYWSGPDGTINYISPSCQRISGYSVSEFVDDPALFLKIILKGDRGTWDGHGHDVRNRQKASEIQFRIRTKSGEIRWIDHVCLPVYDGQGKFLGIRASNRDISERKKAEFEVQQQRNELAHVNRTAALGELTSSIAHEINQPLAAIRNYANAAQRFLSQSEPDLCKARDALEGIVRDDRRAAEVITSIREILRNEGPRYRPVKVNQVIQEVFAFIRSDAVIEGLAIEIEIAPTLPVVTGDRVQLQQVLLNLILNAVDAMNKVQPDQRKLVIKTENKDDRGVQVSVKDSGPGINEAQRAKLFESFFSTKPEGMGMGLAISHRIIHAHGGTIWGENNPDGGATFGFTLPTGNNG
jgi:PAS domain S-box-containing protein